MRLVIPFTAAALATLSACGLVLGIDDVPPVPGLADAGHADVRKQPDAQKDHGVDMGTPDTGHDARGDGEAGPVGVLPKPMGGPTTSDADVNFAVHYLWIGDSDMNSMFTPDPSAWQSFGYNIDGLVTTSASTDVCTLAMNASPNVQTDGNLGADNSFGENIVEGLSLLFTGLSANVSNQILKGAFTFLLDTKGLTLSPTQSNTGLSASFFGGAVFPGVPTFTLADNWPIDPATLVDGSLGSGATVTAPTAYVTNGTWVSGDPTEFTINIEILGRELTLVFHEAVLTFQHTIDDDGQSHAMNGTLAGILKPSEVIASLTTIAAAYENGMYCDIVPTLSARIIGAQDILLTGGNQAGVPCDGISIAVAFVGDQIQPPSLVAEGKVYPDAAPPVCLSDGGDAQ
jgi:hypothetical protein